MISNRTYDLGKKLVQVWLPATGALYFGLAATWDLPRAEEVVGTLAIIATFLGIVLGISNAKYESSGRAYDGRIVVTSPEEGPKNFSLELDGDPNDIENQRAIRFKVAKEQPMAVIEDFSPDPDRPLP